MEIKLNMNVNLRQGGRVASQISMEEFIEKYEQLEEKHGDVSYVAFYEPSVKKDLKVYMNIENYECSYQTTSTGIPYLFVEAASDYSPWMVFMIYWDGNKFRAYVPTYGNPWNTKTKKALGEYPEKDAKFILSQLDEDTLNELEIEDINEIEDMYLEDVYSSLVFDIHYDREACIKDFESRIVVK